MNIPQSVKIGCHTYDVRLVDSVSKTTAAWGKIDYFDQVILLDRELKDDSKAEVLLHEIMHGVAEFMGVELEEKQVDLLSKGLAMVFRDNPQLFESEAK